MAYIKAIDTQQYLIYTKKITSCNVIFKVKSQQLQTVKVNMLYIFELKHHKQIRIDNSFLGYMRVDTKLTCNGQYVAQFATSVADFANFEVFKDFK